MMKRKGLVAVSFAGLMMSSAFASSNTANVDNTNNPWVIDVTPYFWAINMNGTVGVANSSVHIDENFSKVWSQFEGGGMLWVDAHKNNFGLFINSLYAVLAESKTRGAISAHVRTHFGIMSAGASYKVYQTTPTANGYSFAIEPYFGGRYTLSNTTLKVNSIKVSDNQNWTDPILGSRFIFTFNKNWDLFLAGDVGGTNRSSDASYSLTGLVGYKPTSFTNTKFYLGYHILDEHYVTGSGINYFNWDMRLFGPVAGVSFRF